MLNGKGGVGKSIVAVNPVRYLIDRKVEHGAIDTDNENSTLKRFHADPPASHRSLRSAAKLGRLIWRRSQFCRGWLITGDTGPARPPPGSSSWSTRCFITSPTGVGYNIDEKGGLERRFPGLPGPAAAPPREL